MAKQKVVYCYECGKNTVHNKVCAETQGVERLFMGLISAGLSEVCMEHYWACSKCGEIRKK